MKNIKATIVQRPNNCYEITFDTGLPFKITPDRAIPLDKVRQTVLAPFSVNGIINNKISELQKISTGHAVLFWGEGKTIEQALQQADLHLSDAPALGYSAALINVSAPYQAHLKEVKLITHRVETIISSDTIILGVHEHKTDHFTVSVLLFFQKKTWKSL